MAGLLACGSRRGVSFPGMSQWVMTQRYPLTVAGAAVVLGPDMGRPHHIPNCFPHAGHVRGETMQA